MAKGIFGTTITDKEVEREIEIDKNQDSRKNNRAPFEHVKKSLRKLPLEEILEKYVDLLGRFSGSQLVVSQLRKKIDRIGHQQDLYEEKYRKKVMKVLKKRLAQWELSDLPYSSVIFRMMDLNVKLHEAKNAADYAKFMECLIKLDKTDEAKAVHAMEHKLKVAKMKAQEEAKKHRIEKERKRGNRRYSPEDLPDDIEISQEIEDGLEEEQDEQSTEDQENIEL